MKKIYLCTPHKLGALNFELIARIKSQGFEVFSATTHTPQDTSKEEIFKRNVELIRDADIFIAVLKDYGKDLTAEVGMAYAWNKIRLGIDYTALDTDIMSYYAFEKIIKQEELEQELRKYF